MESWLDRLGMEGMVLIGLGVCGVLAAWRTDTRDILKEPVKRKCWKLVEFDELLRLIRSGSIQLFDVREREEVNSTGMIPTATNIPLGELEAAFKMPRNAFKNKYGVEMPYKGDLNIVTSCLKGGRSKEAIEKLHKLGYQYARTYGGSFLEYSIKKARVQVLPTHDIRDPNDTTTTCAYSNVDDSLENNQASSTEYDWRSTNSTGGTNLRASNSSTTSSSTSC